MKEVYVVRNADGDVVRIIEANSLGNAVAAKHRIQFDYNKVRGTDHIFTVVKVKTSAEIRRAFDQGFWVGRKGRGA